MAESEHTLLSQAIAGDRDALSALLGRCGTRIKHTLEIARKWQSVLSAEDVMQVTYMEAFLRIERFQPHGEGAFYSWLRQIAENNLRDAIKGLERAKRPQPNKRIGPPGGDESFVDLLERLTGTTTSPSGKAARREIKQYVEAALAKLPQDYQKVVRLFDLEGRSVADVASALGRSEGAAYMLRARALERLRQILGSPSKFFSD